MLTVRECWPAANAGRVNAGRLRAGNGVCARGGGAHRAGDRWRAEAEMGVPGAVAVLSLVNPATGRKSVT
jgi:hypothetical protein